MYIGVQTAVRTGMCLLCGVCCSASYGRSGAERALARFAGAVQAGPSTKDTHTAHYVTSPATRAYMDRANDDRTRYARHATGPATGGMRYRARYAG